jgi:hypothetical protein
MSFNALKFTRSQHLRDSLGRAIPTDVYWNYVIALVRTNPKFTGTRSFYANRTLFSSTVSDSDSPTFGNFTTYNYPFYYLSANSPYTSYPSSDNVYSFSTTYPAPTPPDATSFYRTLVSYTAPHPTANPALPVPNSGYNTSYHQFNLPSANNIGVAITNGFTLECWVYVPAAGSANLSGFLIGAQHSLFLSVNSNLTVNVKYIPFYRTTTSEIPYVPADQNGEGGQDAAWFTTTNGVSLWEDISTETLTTNKWNHVAVTCNYTPQVGNNIGSTNLFINGRRVGQQPNPTIGATVAGVRTPYTESGQQANAIIIGSKFEITGIRFIAGHCLSVDNFIPPTSKVNGTTAGWNNSTSTFTHNACFVSHFSNNGDQLPLIDYSKYRHYVTNLDSLYGIDQTSNLPAVSNATTNLKSIAFDGAFSYPVGLMQNPQQQLINTNNSILGLLNTQDFTVNFFFYKPAQTTTTTEDVLFDHGLMRLVVTSSNTIIFRNPSSNRLTLPAGSSNINTWYYVQFSRIFNSPNSRTYKLTAISSNGTVYTAADFTDTRNTDQAYAPTAAQLFIGADTVRTQSNIFNGYIVDYRVTAGMVRPTPTSFPIFHPVPAVPV